MRKLSLIKRIRRIFPVILLVFMLISAPGITFASSVVEFTGPQGTDHWNLNTEDLFGEKTKQLAPGMVVSVEVQLLNTSNTRATFSLILRPKITDETISLLEAVDIVMTYKILGDNSPGAESEIYRGKFGGSKEADLYSDNGAKLGVLNPKQSGIITVTISISSMLGNEYMEKACSADWEFIASEVIPINILDNGDRAIVESTDPDVPLTEEAELDPPSEDIDSNKVLGDKKETDDVTFVSIGLGIPQTGGVKTFVLPLVIVLIILAGLFIITFYKSKNKNGRKTAE